MGRFDKLHERTEASRLRAERIGKAVQSVVTASPLMQSALSTDEPKVSTLVDNITNAVSEVVDNVKLEFIDALKARGQSERRIAFIVERVNELFHLTDSSEYEDKLEVVAKYMQENPRLYDEVCNLRR